MLRRTILGLGLIVFSAACGGDDDRPPPPPQGPKEACPRAEYDCDIADRECAQGILELTACIRGDDVPELPKINRVTAAQFGALLRAEAEERGQGPSPWDPVLRALSLVPSGATSIDAAIDEAVQSVAAFYDSETKEVSVIEDAAGMPAAPRDRAYVLSHELTHALQDRAHDLTQLQEESGESTDRRMALGMLVEGEATVTSTRVLVRLLGRSIDRFSFGRYFDVMDDSLSEAVEVSPGPLSTVLQGLPYSVGGRYVARVWEQSEQDGVEALFEAAPPTAADWIDGDVSDPERSRGEPLDCGPPLAPPGFALYELDRLGAAGVIAMLGAHDAVDLSLAGELANDAFALYVSEGAADPATAPVIGVWRLRFRTARAIDSFEQVLNRAGLSPRRAGTELLVRVSSPAASAVLQGSALDACTSLDDLRPVHATPTTPSAALKPRRR
ncbi:MAG TPA: hypothetical protein VJR89_12095 [Polyangiales bacterium]|nr:hypothetical protein [Polyangiales bacterium]